MRREDQIPKIEEYVEQLRGIVGYCPQMRNLAYKMQLLHIREPENEALCCGLRQVADWETLSTVSDMTEALLYMVLKDLGIKLKPGNRSGFVEYPYLIARAKGQGLLTSKHSDVLLEARAARNYNHPEKQEELIVKKMRELSINPFELWRETYDMVLMGVIRKTRSTPIADLSMDVGGTAIPFTYPGFVSDDLSDVAA